MRTEYDLKNMEWVAQGKYAAQYAKGVVVNGVKQEPTAPVAEEPLFFERLQECDRCGVRLPKNVEGFEFTHTKLGTVCPACQEDLKYGYTNPIDRIVAVIERQIRRRKIQSN